MGTPKAITITGTKHPGHWEYAITCGMEAIAGRGKDEVDAARLILAALHTLPVVPVRLAGDIPGMQDAGLESELYHVHTVREYLSRIIGNAARRVAMA